MELKQSKRELEKSRASIEAMRTSEDITIFESNWRDFLNNLEKVWIKSERECQIIKNKFQPWQGKFTKLRRNDPLLKYLKNARDADVHSIQEIVDKKYGSTKINFANKAKGGFIKKMVIQNGKIEHYEGDPIDIDFTAASLETTTFTNNGQTYTVPQYHRGIPIKNANAPIVLAELGLTFYTKFLEDIETNF